MEESLFKSPFFLEDKRKEDDLSPHPLVNLSAGEYLEVLKAYKRYQPLDGKDGFIREVFGREPEALATVKMRFLPYKHLLLQKALFANLDGWKVIRGANFTFMGRREPVEYMAFDVDYNRKEEGVANGILHLEGPCGEKLVAELRYVEYDERLPRSELRLSCEAERKGWVEELRRNIEEWMEENNYFIGKKLKPDGSFIPFERPYSWNDIILPPDTERVIKQNLLDYFRLRDLFRKNRLPFKRGLICHGPPGTGKTLLGKVIACEVDATFIWITPADVERPLGVSSVFSMGRELSPAILFFEDLDLYASRREANKDTSILGEFLAQMDGFVENEDVFVIASTNDLEAIEPALRERPSRFDCVVEFGLLTRPMRERMLLALLKDYRVAGDRAEMARECADLLGDVSGAQVKEFFLSAVRQAIEDGSLDDEGNAVLSTDLFRKARDASEGRKARVMGFLK